MKLIAHRGASKEKLENTVEALNLASEIGAYAAECDIRKTSDGVFVLFHDINLKRLAGSEKKVNDITFKEMREILENAGLSLNTFDDACKNYTGSSYILCDIGNENWQNGIYWECDDEFFKMLADAPFNVICGVHRPEEAKLASKFFPKEQILAFMPKAEEAEDFYKNGAGIIRLWEQWLDNCTPADIKEKCPDAEVWIMSNKPDIGQDGCPETLKRVKQLGADGVLLNDIRMAVETISKI